MTFTKPLREGIRRGRIRCSVRIWTRPHVRVGGRYRMDEGHIVVDSIAPMTLEDVTYDLAREATGIEYCSGMPMGTLPANTSIIIPRLVCRDPAAEIDFCVRAFEATELNRRTGPDGSVAHALLRIGPEMVMIEAEWPSLPSRAPKTDGTSPVVIFLYVPNVDETVERAVATGAKVVVPLQNQFWGDRIAWLMDPAGHVWTVATRIEETTAEERTQRWETLLKQGAS